MIAALSRFMRSTRMWILTVMAVAVIAWYWFTDPAGGADTKVRLQAVAWGVVLATVAYLIRRGLMGEVRSRDLGREAAKYGNVAAGVALAGAYVLVGLIFLGLCSLAHGAEPPAAAVPLLPVLHAEQVARWPSMPFPSTLGSQIEQETCPGLKSRSCWNPRAELKTSREYGFGLGQITITSRFDNLAVSRGLDPSLRDWKFEDRFDPARQLRVIVLMDRGIFGRIKGAAGPAEQAQMMFAAYNGGEGGLSSDRRMCVQKPGCNPAAWFGHVERTSLKQRTVNAGYGQSAFDINRGYVDNIWRVRRARYASLGA